MFLTVKILTFPGDLSVPARYKIIDSDFETEVKLPSPSIIDLTAAVLQEYSKRNLNVPMNFIKFFMYMKEQHPWLSSIETYIYWCKNSIPGFDKYEKKLQKYLVLI